MLKTTQHRYQAWCGCAGLMEGICGTCRVPHTYHKLEENWYGPLIFFSFKIRLHKSVRPKCVSHE